MGVTGLWRLLEGNGRPVVLESMEGKVLAVDISIWLNMAVKGMQDNHGHSSQNAHLITLFNRICKLLYFGIKPVFVFDGKAPLLKQNTLSERRRRKYVTLRKRKDASDKMMHNYLKKQVLKMAMRQNKGEQPSTSKEDENVEEDNWRNEIKDLHQEEDNDLFHLPPLKKSYIEDEEAENKWEERTLNRKAVFGAAFSGDFKDLLSIDVNSDDFKSMPVEIQHELLIDIKEIHKRRRTLVEKMPEESNSFSSFQLSGILAKRGLSKKINNIEKKMAEVNNTASFLSYGEFDGENFKSHSIVANKISSEDSTHYILIKGTKEKQTVEEDIKKEVKKEINEENISSNQQTSTHNNNSSELLDDDDAVMGISDISTAPLNQKDDNPLNISPAATNASSVVEHFLKKVVKQNDILEKTDPVVEQNVGNDQHVKYEVANSQNSFDQKEEQKSQPIIINNQVEKDADENGFKNDDFTSLLTKSKVFPIDESLEIQLNTAKEHNSFSNSNDIKTSNDDTSAIELLDNNNVVKLEKNSSTLLTSTTAIDKQTDSDNIIIKIDKSSSESDFEEVNMQIPKSNQVVENQPDIKQQTTNPFLGLTNNDLMVMEQEIDTEDLELMERIKVATRAANEVSNQAYSECQELLQLFGIPFVVSPEEAEAQCAFLDANNLTMGTITEDSDIWLFGGRIVYKDFFDKKRDPACYNHNDIKLDMGLERSHLINIALCSGSDYTSGIEDVGPVRALEIMKEFPGEGIESLIKFKKWWDEANAQAKPPKSETKMKGHLRKISVSNNFPSQYVVDAYLHPRVDESMVKFSWGMPNLDALREFAIERLNWTKKKVDEDMLPILRRNMEREKQKQTLMTNYLKRPQSRSTKIVSKKSKRIQRAIQPLLNNPKTLNKNGKKKSTSSRGRKKTLQEMPVKVQWNSNDTNLNLSESSSNSD